MFGGLDEDLGLCVQCRLLACTGLMPAIFRPQSQALTRRAWTHGRAVKPVCAVLSLYMMSAESGC